MDGNEDQQPALLDSETVQKILDDTLRYSSKGRVGLNANNRPIAKTNPKRKELVRQISTASWIAYQLVHAAREQHPEVHLSPQAAKYISLRDEVQLPDIEPLLALAAEKTREELQFLLQRPPTTSVTPPAFRPIPRRDWVSLAEKIAAPPLQHAESELFRLWTSLRSICELSPMNQAGQFAQKARYSLRTTIPDAIDKGTPIDRLPPGKLRGFLCACERLLKVQEEGHYERGELEQANAAKALGADFETFKNRYVRPARGRTIFR